MEDVRRIGGGGEAPALGEGANVIVLARHAAIFYAGHGRRSTHARPSRSAVRAGWNGGNGIQVILKHRSGFIGHVGSTGLSTGPHLDYRVSKRGRFVDPLSEKFLPGELLAGALRTEFERKPTASCVAS